MKTLNKYLFAVLLGTFALYSCSDDDNYAPGPQNEGEAVSFGTISADEELTYTPDEATILTITAYRADGTSAVDVPLTVVENENDRFVIPSTLHFNAGETSMSFQISFPDIELGETATFEIAIADGYQNYYATNMLRRTILRDYNWVSYSGIITDYWMELENSPVTIQRVDGTNQWRVVDPYREAFESAGMDYDYEHYAGYINFEVNADGSVIFETFKSDIYSDGSQIYGFWPLELSSSLTAETELSKAEDSYNVVITPYYYIPGLGGFGTDYPMTVTLDKGQEAEGGVFGDFDDSSEDGE